MTVKNYAIVANGMVENVILWDGESEYPESEGLIDLTANPEVGPGYTYNGTTFTASAQTYPKMP